uniref:Uncharacterized protein n=1 Tax=Anopheles albimanus TaxID=7167 RepID=A0A182FV07_ANOAL
MFYQKRLTAIWPATSISFIQTFAQLELKTQSQFHSDQRSSLHLYVRQRLGLHRALPGHHEATLFVARYQLTVRFQIGGDGFKDFLLRIHYRIGNAREALNVYQITRHRALGWCQYLHLFRCRGTHDHRFRQNATHFGRFQVTEGHHHAILHLLDRHELDQTGNDGTWVRLAAIDLLHVQTVGIGMPGYFHDPSNAHIQSADIDRWFFSRCCCCRLLPFTGRFLFFRFFLLGLFVFVGLFRCLCGFSGRCFAWFLFHLRLRCCPCCWWRSCLGFHHYRSRPGSCTYFFWGRHRDLYLALCNLQVDQLLPVGFNLRA